MGKRSPSPRRGKPAARVEFRATIQDVSTGGDGLAFVEHDRERRAVFVRGGAPGDEVLLSVDLSTRPAQGQIERLEVGGPSRIEPPCPHAARCGGCAWMHLSLSGQREAHRARIRGALPLAWRDVPLEVHEPKETLGYRSRARLHAVGSGGRVQVGFQRAKTHELVEVDACLVLHPGLERARLSLAPLLGGARGHGEARIALGHGGRPVLELHWEGRLSAATFGRLELAVKEGALAGARVFEGGVHRPAVWGDPSPWTVGADGEPLKLAAGGFAQASEKDNELLAARLLALSLAAARTRSTDSAMPLGKVVELYAGAGNFTTLLAKHADRTFAIESSAAACEAHRENLAARGLDSKRVRVILGLAEEYEVAKGTNLVVLDPPRTGARLVVDRLLESKPKAIAYVSCDVPTLARDLALLVPAYAPFALEAFTMFPHTPHVETLAVMVARSRSSSSSGVAS